MAESAPPGGPARTEEPANRNIEAIAALEREALHDRTAIDRATDAITGVAGSPVFVLVHGLLFTGWIALNLIRRPPFDPYPFSLLTLAVSLEAIFLTAIVLMTQNRMARQADKRAHLDLQVNLLAEQELTAMLNMLRELCERSGVHVPAHDRQVDEFLGETDIHKLAETVEQELTAGKLGKD